MARLDSNQHPDIESVVCYRYIKGQQAPKTYAPRWRTTVIQITAESVAAVLLAGWAQWR
jgi:hypothetical protein